MKIAYVSDAVYPYNKGGKEKRLYELSTRLARMGHDVHIYTMHWWAGTEKSRVENGVHLHAISKLYPMYKDDKRSIKQGVLFGLACLKLLKIEFDVLDADHMPFFPIFSTWVVCKLKRQKLYGTWHEALTLQDWTSYMGKAGYIAAAIERLSIKLPYKITAGSAQTQRLLAQYHKRKKRVGLVPSGIDASTLHSIRPTQAKCDVLYVGRFVKDKNVDKLIEAFALVAKQRPDARCTIIGHGVEKANLVNLVKKLRLTKQVSILDPLPDAHDIYAYMKRAKVFVLPSMREGFGIVALEALACGTPVVTINAPANAAKDLIEPGKTGSIAPLDAEALATEIHHWLAAESGFTQPDLLATHDWTSLANTQTEVYAL